MRGFKMTNRRHFVKSAITVAAGIGVAGTKQHAWADRRRDYSLIYVFVHGAWHGAWCFERVAHLLTNQGHQVIALDLPGSGLNAGFPAAYWARPFDPNAFATETSPVANVTLDDYVRQVTGLVRKAIDNESSRVVLVGHSMGGIVLNAVGELLGRTKIRRLVYLTAFMPRSGVPATDYVDLMVQNGSLLFQLLVADIDAIGGAARIDPSSPDPLYRTVLRETFYGDVTDDDIPGIANLLTPDQGVLPISKATSLTSGWGSIPRTFIACSEDNALPLAVQQQFINEADLEFPGNLTEVVTLKSSHSPFLSQPQRLAQILGDLKC